MKSTESDTAIGRNLIEPPVEIRNRTTPCTLDDQSEERPECRLEDGTSTGIQGFLPASTSQFSYMCGLTWARLPPLSFTIRSNCRSNHTIMYEDRTGLQWMRPQETRHRDPMHGESQPGGGNGREE